MMKKTIAIILSVLFVLTIFQACGFQKNNQGAKYNLYFANSDLNALSVESRNISIKYDDYDDEDDVAEIVLKELLKGPSDSSLKAVIPDGTKLMDVDVEDGIALVNFSKDYYDNDAATELLARFSVVNTLCEISGIQKIKIFVDGVELINSTGSPVGAIGKSDIADDSTTENTQMVKLYFSNKDATSLVCERRNIALVDNNLEKSIVTELIKGPVDPKLNATIPTGTNVMSIETKEGICFVNLSDEFVSKHSGGSSAEVMTIYSVVNSLTELENVYKVQFLVGGKKLDVYKHMMLSEPFERDETVISK